MKLSRNLSLCSLAVAWALGASPAQASLVQVYSEDFQSGTGGFSNGATNSAGIAPYAISQGVTQYLGRFTLGDSTTLTLTGLAPHTAVRLVFDLYQFETWDGSSSASGPDRFSLSGDISFSETFTNHHGTQASPLQSFPTLGNVFLNSAGTAMSGFGVGDIFSTQAFFDLGPLSTGSYFQTAHTASTFSVTFGGPTTQTDEQWGIDNVEVYIDTVEVTATPEPATMVLFGLTGLGGIGLRWRQRRKALAA